MYSRTCQPTLVSANCQIINLPVPTGSSRWRPVQAALGVRGRLCLCRFPLLVREQWRAIEFARRHPIGDASPSLHTD